MNDKSPEADPIPAEQVYAAIGLEGFRRLCDSFYGQVASDDLLGPMYPADDMDGARQRLQNFLVYRFGGPADYIAQRGHPRLRARHLPFKIDQSARDRWMDLMTKAINEAELEPGAAATLLQFFGPTATFMINQAPPS